MHVAFWQKTISRNRWKFGKLEKRSSKDWNLEIFEAVQINGPSINNFDKSFEFLFFSAVVILIPPAAPIAPDRYAQYAQRRVDDQQVVDNIVPSATSDLNNTSNQKAVVSGTIDKLEPQDLQAIENTLPSSLNKINSVPKWDRVLDHGAKDVVVASKGVTTDPWHQPTTPADQQVCSLSNYSSVLLKET